MTNIFRFFYFLIVALISLSITRGYAADYIAPNNVTVNAQAHVSYDSDTGLYTYQYAFTNLANSVLDVTDIMVPLNSSSAINIIVPRGWSGGTWSNGSVVDFAATEIVPLPPNVAWDGSFPDVAYKIKRGQTLRGFSFQSVDPPDIINFYAQGFTQLPEAAEEAEPGQLAPSPLDPSQSFSGRTKGPKYSDQLFLGNRRGAVDGFLVFRNIANRDTKPAPIQVDIEFGINGETVDQTTFKAYLNSQDITAQFIQSTDPNKRRAVFQPNQLNIGGRNTLLTTVQGIIPNNGRTAGDTDRVTFTVSE